MIVINYNFEQDFSFEESELRFFIKSKSIRYDYKDNEFYLYNWGSSPTAFESSYSDYVINYV